MSAVTEWDAEEYALISGLQSAMAAEVLALVQLNGTERVLDVGCGDGKITAAIAAQVPGGSVVGVDPSEEMIGYAAKHFAPPAYPNIKFQVADARQLTFRDEFDLIVSFNALHWVPEQDAALAAIAAALKPNGRAQLRLVSKGERKSLEETIEDTRLASTWSHYFPGFSKPFLHLTPEQYTATAERNGLDVLRANAVLKAWDFKTRSAFEKFGSVTFAAWTHLLPDDLKIAFVSDVLDRYLSAGDGNVFHYYQMDVTAKIRI